MRIMASTKVYHTAPNAGGPIYKPRISTALVENARNSWAATSSSVETTPDMDHAGDFKAKWENGVGKGQEQ